MSSVRSHQWHHNTVRWIAAIPLCMLLLSTTAVADPARPI